MPFFKQVRFTVRFLGALVEKYYLALGLGTLLGVVSFILAPQVIKLFPTFRYTNTIGVVGRFTQTDIPISIQQKISVGLTNVDASGLAGPAIASGWEASDSGKVYTFHINTGLKWQDGTPLKSQDINYQFKDTITEYPSDSEMIIKLKDPFAPLPVVVSRPVFKSGLLGLGSYRASSFKKNGELIDTLTLVPVDKKSHLPNLVYKFYPSETQAKTAFKLGLVQRLEDVQDPGELATWTNANLQLITHFDRYVAIFFNNQDDYLKGGNGKFLRQALAYAINKTEYINPAHSPLNPSSWAYNSDVKKYNQDLIKAKQLLTRVGKLPPEITLNTIPAFFPLAENIKRDWEAIGIPTKVIVSSEVSEKFSVLLIAQAVPVDPDQYNQWHSTQSTNLTNLTSQRIDRLLELGRKTLDLKERRNIYLDFQRYLVEETPVVFLFHPTSYTINRK